MSACVIVKYAPHQDSLAFTTRRKEVEHCVTYIEIANSYKLGSVDERDLSPMVYS